MRREIVSSFIDEGMLVGLGVCELILQNSDPHDLVNRIVKRLDPYRDQVVISCDDLSVVVNEIELDDAYMRGLKGYAPSVMSIEADIVPFFDITGNSICEGAVDDFAQCFQSRFTLLSRILKDHGGETAAAIAIDQIRNGMGNAQFIGIVKDIRNTRNGNKIVEIEDMTDHISCFISKHSRLIEEPLVNDEVLYVKGTIGDASKRPSDRYPDNRFFRLTHVIYPDAPFNRKPNKSHRPVSVAFISDLHIGSDMFLSKEWSRFVEWIRGNVAVLRHIAERIKYLVIVGDVVDGIGIHPSQRDHLDMLNLRTQYQALADELSRIPDHIEIIVLPGNHDAVRLAEPQPALPKWVQDMFDRPIRFMGNPSYFALDGVEIMAYHGRSFDDWAVSIPGASHKTPMLMMEQMLKKRHLGPIYRSKNQLAPEHEDHLVIRRVPDILVTGHIHRTEIGKYRSTTLINASAWQSQTGFQQMMNFMPEPARVPIVDLDTLKTRVLSFETVPMPFIEREL